MAAAFKFNATPANAWNGVYNLGADTVKAILSNVAPAAGNAVYADVVEIAAGNGYAAGGVTLTLTSSTQSGGLYKYIASAASPTWTAAGAMATFRYVFVYDFTPASKPLLGAWDYGSSLSLTVGQTFTLQLDATNGLIQCS